jgi:hypothetical protein
MNTEEAAGSEVSPEYGMIPPGAFLALWSAPQSKRFRYRPIRVGTFVISLSLLALWIYYGYTLLFGVGLTLFTGLFGLFLLLLSAFVALELIRWRLFVLRSGVVTTEKVLAWRSGAHCFLAPWALIDPEALGIGELGFGGVFESKLVIRVRDTAEVLFLVRLFARLEDQEAFLAELLHRIPRENWKNPQMGGEDGDGTTHR